MSDQTLNAFVASGTNAERLAFVPDPPTPVSGPDPGYFFYETDTGNTYTWDGSAWDQVNVPATGASTTEVLTGTNTTKMVTPDSLAALWEKGGDISSSGTISVGEGGFFHVTGTTTITDIDFGTDKSGRKAILVFDDALTLTHNGTTLILPTGANITTAAGDCCLVVSENGTDNVRVVWYQKANGQALAGSSSGGSPYPTFTTPVDGDFAWVNQGSASVAVNANGGIFLRGPTNGAGANLRVRKKAAPSAPWTLTVAMFPFVVGKDFQSAGILTRESSSGKIITLQTFGGNSASDGIQVTRWNSATSFNTNSLNQVGFFNKGLIWYRIADNSTNLIYSYSLDGYNFIQVFSEARGSFYSGTGFPNEIGFYVDEETNTFETGCTILSWAQT